ncbi:hypothetical protein Sjap_017771 [Stephania japonica]|uniref:Uncharacterized protein n=1 Tax=Stephania japonica TaxID=461633 RepID=A0AAP0I729_9MAGN
MVVLENHERLEQVQTVATKLRGPENDPRCHPIRDVQGLTALDVLCHAVGYEKGSDVLQFPYERWIIRHHLPLMIGNGVNKAKVVVGVVVVVVVTSRQGRRPHCHCHAAAAAAVVGDGAPIKEPHLRQTRGGWEPPLGGSSSPTPYEPWRGEGRGGSPPFLCLDGGRTGEAVVHWPVARGPPRSQRQRLGRRGPIEGSLSSPPRLQQRGARAPPLFGQLVS